MLTADQIAARTDRALRAAEAAGRSLGLTVTDPRVLHDVFSVVVHLAPAPVVVRVPTVLPPAYTRSPERQAAQQHSELSVAGWLADRGHPVVAPSPLVPRQPVRRDGFSMTFWQYAEELPNGEPDIVAGCAQTARLHAALRDYGGPGLGFWTPFNGFIPAALAALDGQADLVDAADLARARQEWAVLRPVLESRSGFDAAFPGRGTQTIHGDAPFYNMIRTADGLTWADFELVTAGPVESDLAMAGPAGIEAYNEAAAACGLRRLDERVLRVTEAAARLGTVAALAMAPELPLLLDALAPVLEQWRCTPPLTSAIWTE
ncbi:phosphotransferase [[Mycobacterium] wendilense]|uniref:Phosphotransferase n=1 Tax=[Mycobacterium] wendilense TaxID=3064284 RepID=A0ABN9P5J0_9MYCO|nr:phosphotransferase [Mycolicibacterium sp. MU0050]CAJ1582953.1 phosphotransferase [Mycolicibacterium sp. MU0050]